MEALTLAKISDYAQKAYNDANCEYDGQNYFVHINMVVANLFTYKDIINDIEDFQIMLGAAYLHDSMEDAKQTFNDIAKVAGKEIAGVVLKVTDVPAENRLMKHLLTMGKTVSDYRSILLKMFDMLANASYSKEHQSRMFPTYVEEYLYRRPIFMKALTWYVGDVDHETLRLLWKKLDEVHNYKHQ
jgi:(p)ppGpp synthase/HD superfamily hydrolase